MKHIVQEGLKNNVVYRKELNCTHLLAHDTIVIKQT